MDTYAGDVEQRFKYEFHAALEVMFVRMQSLVEQNSQVFVKAVEEGDYVSPIRV
jgi:hypothetical protein